MNEIFQPGTVKPEADYLELERLSKKLGIPVPMMHIKVEATNPDGSAGEKYEGRSRTFNRNFWNAVFTQYSGVAVSSGTFGAGVLSVKNTSGTTKTIGGRYLDNPNPTLNGADAGGIVVGGLGLATGIVVGTGSTAESFENNTLVTLVAHGTGAGQLSYAAQVSPTPSYVAGTKTWTSLYTRIFNNNSGGTIIVAETGIYYSFTVVGSTATVMAERTLLGATVSVLNAGQLTITYTITLTFPA